MTKHYFDNVGNLMAIEFSQIDHRPYPMPSSCWTWKQSWCDLLFAHWVVPVAELQPLIPAELELDTYEGQAWVGVVPFTMYIRHRLAPPLADLASYFPEVEVFGPTCDIKGSRAFGS